MSYSNVFNILGVMICGFGVIQILPLIVSIIYNDGTRLISLLSMLCTLAVGAFLFFNSKQETKKTVQPKEAMLLVTLAWFSLSILGSVPFLLTNQFTFIDAFFETVSALTTTGASVIPNVEILPKSLLFWRCFMQWIGGMGIVVFSIAVMPFLGKNTLQVFHAEVPGVITDKVKPKLKDTALFLWRGYLILSLLCCISLIIGGMDLFDAMAHTFTTVSTGGFSTKNTSLAFFSGSIQWIVIIFMFVSGINFALLFFAMNKEGVVRLFNDPECTWYMRITFFVSVFIVITLIMNHVMSDQSLEYVIRTVIFQVVSIFTTTGFVTVDYSVWPSFTLILILFITFTGGSGGSTSGGFKVIRMLILTKLSTIGFLKRLHPNAIRAVKIDNFVISENIFLSVTLFFVLYIALLFVGTCVLTLFNLDLTTSFTAVLTCLTNVGPGLGAVGPAYTFVDLPVFVKYVLSFLMIVGRLELYTVLILFFPLFWKV